MSYALDINIKEFAAEWKERIATRIKASGITPSLVIFQIGDNEASNRYVRNKAKDCTEVGIECYIKKFPEGTPQHTIALEIKEAQFIYDAAMLQLPLPAGYNEKYLINLISKYKDVDGLTEKTTFKPCTPLGIMTYLKACNFNFDGANVVICGRSEIVGKPLAQMLQDENATVTMLHSHTKNHKDYYRIADLIISAVGKADFLDCENIFVPVVDVGINFKNGKMVGDCFNTKGRDVTPVPGGVGLLTRCALLENTLEAALEERKYYD